MISVVILSKASAPILEKMTQYAVDSANAAGVGEVIVLEQIEGINYKGATTVLNEGEFNYNASMNKGEKHCKGDYIAMANNDMYFYPNFACIERIMKDNGILSASPYCLNSEKMQLKPNDGFIEGYEVGKTLLGYCIVVNKKVFSLIGEIEDSVKFWWSETLYANQLKKQNIKHYLICNVFIDHFESVTVLNEDKTTIKELMNPNYDRAIRKNAAKNIQAQL